MFKALDALKHNCQSRKANPYTYDVQWEKSRGLTENEKKKKETEKMKKRNLLNGATEF